ncbi:hypothetical protein BDBG_08829 [Blastomyces gilchristii SLH14081]|uniref:Uncharacterized protein n=1 Tax=Blastomyces gilchristii (strain SLH14081) TaxID=559298 RepID=A0A179V0U5_BLAGS|nr:uncharacterized protein BDBG_08829 [Blastomyces gilchristii SLH14081]OAT13673.1 hypothetical protein BDBG_08829 [Blastomyces gilchristii SLH14081]
MSIKPLREKIKRVFSRSDSGSLPGSSPTQTSKDSKNQKSSRPKNGYWPSQARDHRGGGIGPSIGVKPGKIKYRANGKPKIELYKAHEVPRSKYRGPFDEAHIQRLAAYSISNAMLSADRPRSMLSELSPMGTRAPPSRRGSVESERGVVQCINGGVGDVHQRHPLMPSKDASGIISSTVYSTSPITTTFSERRDIDSGPPIAPNIRATILQPVDGNMSSSTLLTLQTQDTLPTQVDAATISAVQPNRVSEAEKEAVSPSMSRPVSSEQLSSALHAIKLRS